MALSFPVTHGTSVCLGMGTDMSIVLHSNVPFRSRDIVFLLRGLLVSVLESAILLLS